MIVAALTVVTLLFHTGLFEELPEATLAAVRTGSWSGNPPGKVAVGARRHVVREREGEMGQAIGDILPLAIGVAISPVPIIAVVLMLGTPRGRTTGVAFALGWVAGLAIVGAVVLLVESGSAAEDSGEPATWASLVKLGIGVLFALLALEQCRPGSPAEPNGSPAALSRSGGQLGWGTILM